MKVPRMLALPIPRLLQVGYKTCREDKITKPELGHLQKAGAPAMKHLREFKVWSTPACCCQACRSAAAGGVLLRLLAPLPRPSPPASMHHIAGQGRQRL